VNSGPSLAASSEPALASTPTVLRTLPWPDYALLDSGDGHKLERYGEVTVVRPEPQCLWRPRRPELWAKADATFDPSDEEEAGRWRLSGQLPDSWTLSWQAVRFTSRLTPFRHLAFFPEQAANWAWLHDRVAAAVARRPTGVRVLNLFGYTGVASLVCAAAGAEVTHVDASKKSVAWARENAGVAGLSERPIRWVVEDARRYVQRELRRGSRYDGVILDPPKYGRGPTGEVWRLFEDMPEMVQACAGLLTDQADFLLLNAYAARISGLSLGHLMAQSVQTRGGAIDWGELALVEDGAAPREIGLSFFARWRQNGDP
jgi:23S rRNA (cytosine1962-C5)-methyltransferase